MKKIRIKFVDFWDKFDCENNFFVSILKEKYEVEFSEEPQYLFYSMFSKNFLKYNNCVRIFFTGENIIPDFNLCDYAMGFDWIIFGDRYLRTPLYLLSDGFQPASYMEMLQEGMEKTKKPNEVLNKKTDFCSFVYSNGKANPIREELFNILSKYKKVNSGGRFLNNIGGAVDNKKNFETQHKFSIACENSSYPGYTTEKLLQAFAAHTIPIYWGDPEVGKVFNKKAFIDVNDYSSMNQLLNRIKELDNDNEKYIQVMKENMFLEDYKLEDEYQKINQFLFHIFDQPYENVYRRNLGMQGGYYERFFKRYASIDMNLKKLKRIVKK